MAGAIQPLMETFSTPGNAAPGAAGSVQPGPRDHGYDIASAVYGPDQNIFMEQTSWSLHQGNRLFTFLDDFYFRIYAIPTEIAYGTFSADTTKQIRLWNAYFGEAVLTTVTPAIGTEVAFDQQGSLPISFGALEIKIVSFTADGEGDTVLADNFLLSFTVDSAFDDVSLDVSGFRVPVLTDIVFPFPPNWDENVEIEYEFKTDIIRSANGREQRRQLRQTPRKSFRFSIAMQNTDRLEYRRLVTANQRGRFFVPELTRFVTTVSDMAAEAIVVDVDQTPPWWLAEHDNYVILGYQGRYSLRRIDLAGSDSNSEPTTIYFKSDDNYEWPAGTRIYPAISSYMSDEISGQLLTNYVQTVDLRFLALPGLEAIETVPAAETFFDGRELWLKKPNWAEPPAIQDLHPTVFLDAGVGRIGREVDQDFQSMRLALSYTGRNFEEAEELRHFMMRCAGQCREFFMPTWQKDIIAAQGWISGDDQIIVDGIGFASVYADDPVRNGAGVAIILLDGTIIYKQVEDIFADTDSTGAFSVIQLTETMGQDIDLEDVDKICWVPLWRFSTDTFTYTWLTNSVCETNFVVHTQPWQRKDGDASSNSEIA